MSVWLVAHKNLNHNFNSLNLDHLTTQHFENGLMNTIPNTAAEATLVGAPEEDRINLWTATRRIGGLNETGSEFQQ